jgi:hypothetical protein
MVPTSTPRARVFGDATVFYFVVCFSFGGHADVDVSV